MNLDEYRAAVIAGTACPCCGAREGDPCTLALDFTPTYYVHDDRSAVFHKRLDDTLSRVRAVPPANEEWDGRYRAGYDKALSRVHAALSGFFAQPSEEDGA